MEVSPALCLSQARNLRSHHEVATTGRGAMIRHVWGRAGLLLMSGLYIILRSIQGQTDRNFPESRWGGWSVLVVRGGGQSNENMDNEGFFFSKKSWSWATY